MNPYKFPYNVYYQCLPELEGADDLETMRKKINMQQIMADRTPARILSWEEVISLPPDQKVWFQGANNNIRQDSVRVYKPDSDKLYQGDGITRWVEASTVYGKVFVVWDKLPTEKQFEEAMMGGDSSV